MAQKLKVLHLIDDFTMGGLETKLLHLVEDFPRDRAEHIIVPFGTTLDLMPEFERCSANSSILPQNISNDRASVMGAIKRIGSLAKLSATLPSPDIVHSWSMATHHLLAPLGLMAPGIKGKVLAADGNQLLNPPATDLRSYALSEKVVRHIVLRDHAKVISVSPEITKALVKRKFPERTIETVANGIDGQLFKPVPDAQASLKAELGIPDDHIVIGMASRYVDRKDYKDVPGFIYAIKEMKDRHTEAYGKCSFVLCGANTDSGDLKSLATELGVEDHLHILGPRHDMPRLYSAWDISNVCSVTEPFGLVVPEAMACGTPCVVTKASLFPEMVGETGKVVPVKDPAARANAWKELIDLSDNEYRFLAYSARVRALEKYSHATMVQRYADIYDELASGNDHPRTGPLHAPGMGV